jgi:hypothetical protein
VQTLVKPDDSYVKRSLILCMSIWVVMYSSLTLSDDLLSRTYIDFIDANPSSHARCRIVRNMTAKTCLGHSVYLGTYSHWCAVVIVKVEGAIIPPH